MLNRQKIFLSMLRENGGVASRLALTKWLFMLAHESPSKGGSAFYQFVPYKYGPFSFALYREASALVRDGYLVAPNEDTWSLTELGRELDLKLPQDVQRNSREIVRLYSPLSMQQLLDVVYSRHPWFTSKAVMDTRRAAAIPQAVPAVYTIGYERFLIDGFMDALLRSGIQRIIDVRNNPTSRRYGFHGSTLSRICGYLDMEYAHFPSVGIPAPERRGLGETVSHARLFAMYKSEILPEQDEAIAHIAALIVEKPSALMCMEANPAECHRSHLADAVVTVTTLPIAHLEWPR